MFHYTPASRLSTSYIYPSPHLSSPRDRYLAALAEAKAAEDEYLATEAVRREEDQLRRRLAEIQHGKQQQFLRSRAPYLDDYPSCNRLAILRDQVEEEERLRLFVLREAELEKRRRQEEAALESEFARLRRAHAREQALRLRQQEQREQARLRALVEQSVKVADHHCSCGNQASRSSCQKTPKQAAALHPSVLHLLRPEAKVAAPVEPKRQVKQESELVEALLRQILGISSETSEPEASAQMAASRPIAVQQESAPKPTTAQDPVSKPSATQAENVLDPQKYLEHLFKCIGLPLDQLQQSSSQPAPSSEAAHGEGSETHLLQEFAKLLVPPTTKETIDQPSASSSSSKLTPDAPAKVAAQASSVPAPVAPKAQPSDTSTQSLQEQLEARLNNEFHSEVRDTIQAIFASLQDSNNHEHLASSSQEKGKAKADESSTRTISNPTSKNVVDSFNQVRSIETAFHTLEADFAFPPSLDFIASHLVPDRLASSNWDSSSATTHLAYTSRNHPVRFYEQALTAFLAQLDSIDSFGNDTLRATRKEVVSRIEKALEELEDEVEGRYRARLAKEAKSVSVPIVEVTTASPEVPTSTTSVVPEPKIEDSEEPASAPTVPVLSESASTATSAEEPSSQSSPSPIVPTVPEPAAPADIPAMGDETSSLSSSSVTVKGYEVQAEETTVVDSEVSSPSTESESTHAFLLTAEPETIEKRPNNKDSDDVASDWSEVEA